MGDFGGRPVRFREIGESVEPTVAQRCFQGLVQRDDFPMHGAVAWSLAAFRNCFLVSVNSVFLDLSCVISEMPRFPILA
jgi:hypothetical protein